MSVEVHDDPPRHRYTASVDDTFAGFAAYHEASGQVVVTHTEVDQAFSGQGVGSALARGALDDIRATGRTVVPLCPFFVAYIDRHPEYQDLVAT